MNTDIAKPLGFLKCRPHAIHLREIFVWELGFLQLADKLVKSPNGQTAGILLVLNEGLCQRRGQRLSTENNGKKKQKDSAQENKSIRDNHVKRILH